MENALLTVLVHSSRHGILPVDWNVSASAYSMRQPGSCCMVDGPVKVTRGELNPIVVDSPDSDRVEYQDVT